MRRRVICIAVAVCSLASCSVEPGAGSPLAERAPTSTRAVRVPAATTQPTASTAAPLPSASVAVTPAAPKPSVPSTPAVTVATTVALPHFDLSASATCDLGETLRVGDAGNSVRCLQQRLDEITPESDVVADGVFGTETENQIRLFQAVHNLTVDGVVGPQTAGLLDIWNPAPTPPPAPAQPLAAVGNCHPSYTPCVPRDSDVDCAGGSGNGPSYSGRVSVIGPDEYGLDGNGDGVGCE